MKLFHISDLHLGKRVYEFSMLEEQEELLRQILEHIEQEQPDALLITGDIYDKPVPSVEAVRTLDTFLTALSQRGIHTYIIAGNHDSAQRLEFGRELMAKSGIVFCGAIEKEIEHYQQQDKYGEVNFYLLPFFKPSHVHGLFPEQSVETYQEAAKILLQATEIDWGKRNIILVHQFVTWKGTAQRSDSEVLTLGGVEEIDAGLFFDFDYIALGHLHSPQRIGKDHVRYAGSPMPYSFSEIRQKKGITVVELKQKGEIEMDFIPLMTKRVFREMKGPLESILQAAEEEGSEDYIRCILTNQEALFDPIGRLRSVYPNLMTLEFAQQEKEFEQTVSLETEELVPEEIFSLFFEKQNGKELDEVQQSLLRNIWRELKEEEA